MTGSSARFAIAALLSLVLIPHAPTAAQSTAVAAADSQPPAMEYKPVTSEELLNPSPSDWILPRRTYDGTAFSPLDQINPGNVKNLHLVWSFSTGVTEGHEAPPIVKNGLMFVATPQAQILARDARTGNQIWRYKRTLPDDLLQLHPTSRGVALLGSNVYTATVDSHLVALDAMTGKVVWDTKIADYTKGYYSTLAPLVVKDKIVVGSSGGEMGIRGFLAAFDAQTGKEAWRVYTIPGPGEKGYATSKVHRTGDPHSRPRAA